MAKYGIVPLSNFLLVPDVAADAVALSTGFNTLTRPAGMDGAVIIPAPGTTATLTLKGVTGDTGLVLSSITPSIITCAADIGVTASANATVAVRWFKIGVAPATS